jgi:hypothetical protein
MNGFISYCHHDHEQTSRLRTHLAAIERGFGLKFWFDERIRAGTSWSYEIENAIKAADVFILSMTPDFLASEYIYKVELPAIRNRMTSARCLLVPVVLARCSWDLVASAVQAVPTEHADLKPICDWPKEDGFNKAREQIRDAIEKRFAVSSIGFKWS